MRKGFFETLLGEDSEGPQHQARGPGSLAGAFAAAIAAITARSDTEVARQTSEFLRHQTHLLSLQIQDFREEQPLRIAHLKHQSRLLLHQRIGIQLRIGFQLLIVLAGCLIIAAVAIMIRDAVTSRRVVIEPFDAPPALSARGISGKVVASGLLDALTLLQNATRADAAKRDLSNAWSSEIQLEVPETGMSLSEISQVLRSRFGHDMHISGELVQSDAAGLVLSVRGDGVPPRTFTGAHDQLAGLTTAAAEYVYAKSEPVLWAYYLSNLGRAAEAAEFSRTTFATAAPADRPYLLNTWANALLVVNGPSQEALSLYRSALKLKPDYWVAHSNIIIVLAALGDEEGAWRAGEDMRRAAGGRPGRAPETYYQNFDSLVGNYGPMLDALLADAEANGGVGAGTSVVNGWIADIQLRLHDAAAADITLQTIPPDANDPFIPALTHFVHGRLATEAGDLQRAADEMDAFATLYADRRVSSNVPGYHCWVGAAEDAAGRIEAADAFFRRAGTFVDCYRFRADALDRRGDWVGAQRAYADAVALAPHLPAAYYSWGLALTRHGDVASAERKLMQAHERGPAWADPLKSLGDVLAGQQRWREAAENYDEALRLAPEWTALRSAREVAKRRAGD